MLLLTAILEQRVAEKRVNGAGLSVSLLLLAGGLRAYGTIGAHIACIGNLALERRFCFVLRLPGFRAAGSLVLLFLLPGEFALSLLEGEFCSCHSLPPLAFLFPSGIVVNEKRGIPARFVARRNAPWVITINLYGFYVFGRRAFLTLCDIETDTLALG